MKQRLLSLFALASLLIVLAAAVLWVCVQWRDVDLFVLRRLENPSKGITVTLGIVARREGFVPVARRFVNGRLTVSSPATQPNGTLLAIPFWPWFVFPWLPALWWWFSWRKHRPHRWLAHGQCISCGYDLRASRERCPECGQPIVYVPFNAVEPQAELIVIRGRARVVAREALQMTLFFVIVEVSLIVTIWVLPASASSDKDPIRQQVTWTLGAFIIGGILFVLRMVLHWRHKWIAGEKGIDLYRPGWPPCRVYWPSIVDVFFRSPNLSLLKQIGKTIDYMENVTAEDAAALIRLWEQQGGRENHQRALMNFFAAGTGPAISSSSGNQVDRKQGPSPRPSPGVPGEGDASLRPTDQ